jgi:hypothetical protein
MSVGALLVISSPIEFAKAINVLMLEYENETEAKQRMVGVEWHLVAFKCRGG